MYAVSKSPISASSAAVPWNWMRPPVRRTYVAVGHLDRARGVLLDEQDRRAARVQLLEDARRRGRPSAARGRASARRAGAASASRRARGRSRAAAARRRRAWRPTSSSSAASTGKRSSILRMSSSTAFAVLAGGRADPEVLADGQAPEDAAALGDERDAAAQDLVRREPDDRLRPRTGCRPTTGDERAGDRHQRRRLAGAVVADEAHELALLDLEREALDRRDAPVADRDVLELKHRGAPAPASRP